MQVKASSKSSYKETMENYYKSFLESIFLLQCKRDLGSGQASVVPWLPTHAWTMI